jgi:16S rRNA (adenine1518-N6/adenine1519-N6)-dimethyltransferase
MMLDGHQARRRFSQNFLHDPAQIARIVEAIDPQPGASLIEIGPGLGALTGPLLARAGRLIAIELDRDLAGRLRERFDSSVLDLIEGDALKVDWVQLVARLDAPVRILGNLPYHVSTPLLFALVPIAGKVADQHFLLQREVVDRMVAKPATADYGRLSVMLQMRYQVKKLLDIGPGAFTPAPKVWSSLVRLVPLPADELPEVDAAAFARTVTAAFSQRRKTLRNALSALMDEEGIRAAGVDPKARGETLDVNAFVRLARRIA